MRRKPHALKVVKDPEKTPREGSPIYKPGTFDFRDDTACQEICWYLCADSAVDNSKGLAGLKTLTPGLTDSQRECIAAGIRIQEPATFYRQTLARLTMQTLETQGNVMSG
jgi:hypothetical protein